LFEWGGEFWSKGG